MGPLLADIWLKPHANDFRLYYTAAQLGLRYGWGHLYDLPLQARLLSSLGFQPYLNPPLMAWLALPFSFLPFVLAHFLWTLLLLTALGVSWWLLRPEGGSPRAFWLLGFLALFPAAFSLGIAQPQVLVLLAFAVCVALRARGLEFWAGVALSAVWLKPQLAFLLPVGLVFARQWRVLLGLAVAGGLLGVVQLLALGPSGVEQYLRLLGVASGFELQRRLSLVGLVPGPVFLVLRIVVVGLLAVASLGDRRRNFALVAVPLASLLVTPYSGFQDLALLAGVAWIWLRESPQWWVAAFLLAGWVCAEFTLVWGPWPLVSFEMAWMLLLGYLGAARAGWIPGPPRSAAAMPARAYPG